MRQSLLALCDTYIENRKSLRNAFRYENASMQSACAMIFTDHRTVANIEKMKECAQIIKENTGIFSDFRNNSRLPSITYLSLYDDPQERLKTTMELKEFIQKEFYWNSNLALPSLILSDFIRKENWQSSIQRSKEIYKLFQKNHPFITGSEDASYALFFSLLNGSSEEIVEEDEVLYQFLKEELDIITTTQSLAHILMFIPGLPGEKVDRVKALYDLFKQYKHTYGTSYELATLGILSSLNQDNETIVQEVIEVDDYLKSEKGYKGLFGESKKMRLMHAGMLVCSDYTEKTDNLMYTIAAILGTIAMIEAQQAAAAAAATA